MRWPAAGVEVAVAVAVEACAEAEAGCEPAAAECAAAVAVAIAAVAAAVIAADTAAAIAVALGARLRCRARPAVRLPSIALLRAQARGRATVTCPRQAVVVLGAAQVTSPAGRAQHGPALAHGPARVRVRAQVRDQAAVPSQAAVRRTAICKTFLTFLVVELAADLVEQIDHLRALPAPEWVQASPPRAAR